MSTASSPVENEHPSADAPHWAQPVSKLKVSDVPKGAINLNMEGRQLLGPFQGFCRIWLRTYRVRLSGTQVTPAQVVEDWKQNFAVFQPSTNHFYPSLAGVKPGEVVLIDTTLPLWPGTPGIIPMAAGVIVLYADDEAFTVMTPEGHPLSGWNTFSAYEEDGYTVAQVQGICRASDPIYEFGYRFMGGDLEEDKTWLGVLEALAARWGVKGQVQFHKSLLDPKVQWSHWKNVWNNSAIRTTFYILAAPIRWARNLFERWRSGVRNQHSA